MRRRFSQSIVPASLLLGIAGVLFSFVPPAARAQVNVSISAGVNFSAGLQINTVQDFYDPLGGYGVWFDMPPYGRVWQPAQVEAAWRPYEMGHWEWTDCGWYWVSDEPWAWATYHYGSWVDDPSYGWLWVPGTTWAPAWVVWRESPEYIGWAPCGPNGFVVAAPLFAFVDIHRFHSHFGPRDFIFNNTTIINRTRVINNFRTVDRTFDGGVRRRVVMNEGPSVNVVERAAGTRFTARPIRDVISREPAPSTVQRRSSDLNIQRPALREDATARTGNYRERQPVRRGREQNGSSAIEGNTERSGAGATPQWQRQSQQERQPQQQQQQRNINPVSPTGREQPQTYPQTGRERQPTLEQPRSITPTPQTPQTTPPRTSTSQPAEIDRTRPSQENLYRTAPSQPRSESPPSTARPDEGPTQRPSQFEPNQRPATPPSWSRERSSELNREPRRPEQPTVPSTSRSTTPTTETPDVNRNVKTPPQTLPPPTGREQPRTYPPPEAAPSRPVPERPDVRQPERPTPPPAARERAPQEAPREEVRPAQPPGERPSAAPSRPEPSKERDKERDKP